MVITSFARFGYEGEIVKVEADLRRGIPAIDIVGLPDGAIREARERMRAAIRNSGFDFPRERILINLSPASLRKEGSSFDLSIALAVLGTAAGMTGDPGGSRVMVLGELELSGAVRPVAGILAAVCHGAERGIRDIILPAENGEEAKVCGNARIHGVRTLTEAFHALSSLAPSLSREDNPSSRRRISDGRAPDGRAPDGAKPNDYPIRFPPYREGFEVIHGQRRLIRALEIAAAGGHHLLAYGPPGCGKTLAIRKFPLLLPELDREAAITVTRIYGIAGLPLPSQEYNDVSDFSAVATPSRGDATLARNQPASPSLARTPPFRDPHQGASLEGMTGGGLRLKPGEISLAHGGTLFLDEAPQFKTNVLQALRGPLESGTVTVSRAGNTVAYPARFQLILSMNPCPCGNFGTPDRACVCPPDAVERYWKRLAAPLLDRIDLRVRAGIPGSTEMAGVASENRDDSARLADTDGMRRRIGRARARQWARNRKDPGARAKGENVHWLNAHLDPEETERICALGEAERAAYFDIVSAGKLSGRGAHGLLKVARTIADLADSERIVEAHLREAWELRKREDGAPDIL